MAVTTSALWPFIEALLAKLRADATVATTYDTDVIDGPPLTDLSRPNILFVGAQPSDEQGTTPDATFAQQWGELGARSRYEDLTVACELWVRDGGTNLSALRVTARALMAAIESALRTDYALGVAQVQSCEVQSGQLVQQQTTRGASVSVPFVVAARARLASQ